MSGIGEASLPIFASLLPNTSATNIFLASFILTSATAYMIFVASPTRLTRILVTLLDETEKAYLTAIEAGVLCACDVQAHEISRLRIKVSEIREATLRDSLSSQKALGSFMKGRSFTLFRCVRDTQRFKTGIEILIEERLRDLNSPGARGRTWGTSLLRRRVQSQVSGI
ncbi:hypothetical protein DFH09DRAFT_1209940 [Mycena vulgaris]|nr:hypothetical protein DFH09DRAFT_1209940 [Mycena vulgaris]